MQFCLALHRVVGHRQVDRQPRVLKGHHVAAGQGELSDDRLTHGLPFRKPFRLNGFSSHAATGHMFENQDANQFSVTFSLSSGASSRRMQLVPVIDLMNGIAVHARRGERGAYQPVVSILTPDAADPVALARAYRNKLGMGAIYLADLDAILHDQPNWQIYDALVRNGFQLMLDAGTRTAQRAVSLVEAGVDTVILGLETLRSPAHLKDIVSDSHLNRDRFMLSIDSRNARLLFPETHDWPEGLSIEGLVELALDSGVSSFLMLDLARVGSGEGPGGEERVLELKRQFPAARFWLGGGVQGKADLDRLEILPIEGVMVATALHEGRIKLAEA